MLLLLFINIILYFLVNKMSIATSRVFQDTWLEEEEFKGF